MVAAFKRLRVLWPHIHLKLIAAWHTMFVDKYEGLTDLGYVRGTPACLLASLSRTPPKCIYPYTSYHRPIQPL